ncbi:hypothetical protein FISHEDRAFT_45511 [Fistulina hepatica ATCC 64428]|uniref:Sugar phosphate transporter domain-containing protein n=1 Tax=Fistulina hepatica ATCC 64428 TaxID=1128425 RepID=A0A0D7A9N5_9AGAR|nr:hypothetical protein FISHEDRAFT_45511 [Fistulina hepatica ATCC 64428]
MRVAGVVAFYMCAALIMVFVNKAVLNTAPDLPLLFLFNQLVIAVILLHVSSFLTSKVEIPKLDFAVAKKLVPVVSINVIGLVFNTLCLRGVDASFFQIARGLQLPLTICISAIATHSKPSKRVVFAAAVVFVGFCVGVSPSSVVPRDAVPSLLSLFYGFLSSLSIAIHAVLIKSSLPHCNNSTIQLAWWTNAGSVVMLAPFLILDGELSTLRSHIVQGEWNAPVFIWGSGVTGLFGFLLCVAGLLSIKVTSPITHMFSSAARSVLQTILGVWIFSDILTVNRALSIFVILLGTMYADSHRMFFAVHISICICRAYTWIKSIENATSTQNTANATVRDTSGDREGDLEAGLKGRGDGVVLEPLLKREDEDD